MRNAINTNPRVQLGVLVGGALVLVVMLMRSLGGGGEVPPPGPIPAPASAAPVATAPAPAGKAAARRVSLEIGPGLPARFVSAYNDGEAIALLIRALRGRADRAIEGYVDGAVDDRAELIVIGDAKISDYASVVDGLNVNRTPALVVIRPRGLSGGSPEGEVLYGFRSPRSIRQGVEDALYDGPSRKYAP